MAELTPERWQRISSHLDELLALDESERAAWLEREIADYELRAEVAELAAGAEQPSGVLDAGAGDYLETLLRDEGLLDPEPSAPEGLSIGPYRVVREVGRGGMGIVYLAERADGQFENRVALKLLRPGFDGEEVIRRFERERRIVARLEHPAIARLLDGGVSADGRPYFAMEFVDGEPLTGYCDRRALSIEDRLRLFEGACDAVQYAHGRLIVHRDLKPSNMLVTGDGRLKLVDFGIAKLLTDEDEAVALTRPGERHPLTPAYAAPEQFADEPVTAATDVFALGVVLYELISGVHPFEGAGSSGRDLEQAIRGTDPVAPSRSATRSGSQRVARTTPTATDRAAARSVSSGALGRRLAGDLDAIVMKALRKDPSRRYPSALALREDVGRHLGHRPIEARAEGAAAKASKFVRRHRVGVVVAALLALSLGLGVATTLWQARQKVAQAARAEQVTEFVTSLFESADPTQARGRDITAHEVVERGAERVERELAGQPEIQAEMDLVLGRINDKLGLSEEALALLDRSLGRAPLGRGRASQRIRADALRAKGAALVNLGRAAEAESLLLEAAAEHRRLAGAHDVEVAEDLDWLSIALRSLGRLDESEDAVRRSFELRLAAFGPEHPKVAGSYNNLAVMQRERGAYDQAEANYKRALEIRQRALGGDHPETADTLNNLAALYYHRGRYAEADRAFEQVCEVYGRLYGERHPRTMMGLNNRATVLLRLGESQRSEELYRSILAYWQETAGERHPNALMTQSNLGLLQQLEGEPRLARSTAIAAVDGANEILGREHPIPAIFGLRLAAAARDLGLYTEAAEQASGSLAVLEKVYGSEHAHVAAALEELARSELELGRFDAAREDLERAAQIRIEQTGEHGFEILSVRAAQAAVARGQGTPAEVEAMLVATLDLARKVLPKDHPTLIELLVELGRTRTADRPPSGADPLLREALELSEARYRPGSWRIAMVELRLAELLEADRRSAEAREHAGRALPVLVRELGGDHPLARTAAALLSEPSGRP